MNSNMMNHGKAAKEMGDRSSLLNLWLYKLITRIHTYHSKHATTIVIYKKV